MKKIILVVLACILFLCSYATAEEEPAAIMGEGYGRIEEDIDFSSEDALNQYLSVELFSDGSLASNNGRSHLSGAKAKLYDSWKKNVSEIAKGNRKSTVFNMKAATVFGSKKFYSYSAMEDWIADTMYEIYSYLLIDCPYEMYWHDKTVGYRYQYWYYFDYSDYCYHLTKTLTVKMHVATEYSWGEYAIDTAYAKRIQTSISNAKAVVSRYSSLDDISKLRAYKNEICALTDYNHDAWGSGHALMDYGNPWQFIWVFDGDPNTKVVCEGYAKAFQYLCKMSKFSQKIEALSLYGDVEFEGSGGGHMWNLVSIGKNKKNYLVDVTWCDEGTYGSDALFMAGYSRSIGNRIFYYPYKGGEVEYTYEYELMGMFSSAELGITPGPYWAFRTPANVEEITQEAFSFSGCYSVRLNDNVKSIGEKAFSDCPDLKAVYIPPACTDIAEDAFENCDEVVIYGLSDSKADEYAAEHEIFFCSLQ